MSVFQGMGEPATVRELTFPSGRVAVPLVVSVPQMQVVSRKTFRELYHADAMAAIERGRAALAQPMPAPRCDRPGDEMARHPMWFELRHIARGGRWS